MPPSLTRPLVLALSGALAATAVTGSASADPPPPASAALAAVSERDGVEEIAGELLVDLRDDVPVSALADLGREYGISLRTNSPQSVDEGMFTVADVPPADEAALLARLARDPRVEHAERMAVLRASFVPNDPLYATKQWHLTKAGAERAWDYGCGEGVTVAVIDTGVACYDKGPFSRGTDLAGTRCGNGFNFVDDTPDAADDQGHGTHVAGTIAQTTNNGVGVAGIAPCASLMPVKVLNKLGWGTLADVAEGIRYAADHGAHVINLSLGGPGKSKVLEDAVNHAMKKGVVVVAAAGNSGKSVGYPAGYPGVIAVSATDSNDNIAWFSSRGPEIAIGAPGVSVTQQTICEGGRNKCEIFGTFNGTSMASPHVAGAAATLIGLGVSGPANVQEALQATARPRDDAKLFGAGILDAGAAAARVWWTHVGIRAAALLVLLGLVARRIGRKGGRFEMRPAVVLGALLGGIGLAPFAPALGLTAHLGRFRWLGELAMRPFGEWDVLFGAGLHRWMPLATAIPTMALTAFLFGSRRLRPAVGGFGIGAAALLAQVAITADVAFPMGSVALRVWAVANALVCLWIARLSLDAKS